MNSDIRLAVGFFAHHKTIKLMRKIGLEGVMALISLWLWTAQNRPTGRLVGMSAEDLEIASGWAGPDGIFVITLLELRWLDDVDGVFEVHGWAEHQEWVVGAEARKEKARKAVSARWENAKRIQGELGEYTPSIPRVIPSSSPLPSKEKTFVEGSVELRLASHLFDSIRLNRPEFKKPDLQAWAKHVDLMIRIDKRNPDQIREIIKWAQDDNIPQEGTGFCWAMNILCTQKLRKQFDQLAIKMKASTSHTSAPQKRHMVN